ncbi:MAG: hypothetical protein AN485_20600, partial [Anabaena sp. MDT14b]
PLPCKGMGVLKPLPLQGRGLERGQSIHSKLFKHPLTTDNCTGEAFGELFLAMTDNLSSKCFAPTDN